MVLKRDLSPLEQLLDLAKLGASGCCNITPVFGESFQVHKRSLRE